MNIVEKGLHLFFESFRLIYSLLLGFQKWLMTALKNMATLLVVQKKVAYKSILKAYCYQLVQCKLNEFHCLNNSAQSTKSVRLLTLKSLINDSGLSTNSTDQRKTLKLNDFSLILSEISLVKKSTIFV